MGFASATTKRKINVTAKLAEENRIRLSNIPSFRLSFDSSLTHGSTVITKIFDNINISEFGNDGTFYMKGGHNIVFEFYLENVSEEIIGLIEMVPTFNFTPKLDSETSSTGTFAFDYSWERKSSSRYKFTGSIVGSSVISQVAPSGGTPITTTCTSYLTLYLIYPNVYFFDKV